MRLHFTTRKLKVADLHYEESYHQPPRESTVDRIASGWQTRSVGRLTVNRRADGSLYVIDGVVRVAAARALGIEEIEAHVFERPTLAEEAAMFLTLNSKHGAA